MYRLLYMVEDTGVLQEIETECLAALEENMIANTMPGYVETLQSYLKHNESIRRWLSCTHTQPYRQQYTQGAGNELKTPEERLPYQMAFYIRVCMVYRKEANE